jgi:hypothetical protein
MCLENVRIKKYIVSIYTVARHRIYIVLALEMGPVRVYTQSLFLLFSVKFGCHLHILTLQEKRNIPINKLSVKLKFIGTRSKPG